ncbi:hypothetical protein TUA1478L_35280 [Lactiplantibacillus plantarum]
MTRAILISFCALFLLTGCTSQAEPSISTKQANSVAAANRAEQTSRANAAADASAKKQSGDHYQAADDHITSATSAVAAVGQVLNDPSNKPLVSYQLPIKMHTATTIIRSMLIRKRLMAAGALSE